ncbi:MAG: L-rhamnose mutarotase [Luteolibacter sp.]
MNPTVLRLIACLALCAAPFSAWGRQSIAFAAPVKDGTENPPAAATRQADAKELARHGIHDPRFFTHQVDSRRMLLCTFDLDDGLIPDEVWHAARKDAALATWWSRIDAAAGQSWIRCETLCQLRPHVPAELRAGKPEWHAAVTGLKPEKEAEYRTLHANVWPGVIDAIGQSGIPRFDLFLLELDGKLRLFYLLEFTGKDFANDTAAMGKSPVNQRWWKFTDTCQEPLPGAAAKKQIWEDMALLATPTE